MLGRKIWGFSIFSLGYTPSPRSSKIFMSLGLLEVPHQFATWVWHIIIQWFSHHTEVMFQNIYMEFLHSEIAAFSDHFKAISYQKGDLSTRQFLWNTIWSIMLNIAPWDQEEGIAELQGPRDMDRVHGQTTTSGLHFIPTYYLGPPKGLIHASPRLMVGLLNFFPLPFVKVGNTRPDLARDCISQNENISHDGPTIKCLDFLFLPATPYPDCGQTRLITTSFQNK